MWARVKPYVTVDRFLMVLLILAVLHAGYRSWREEARIERANQLAEEANRNSAQNNEILKSRDFNRLFAEHGLSHEEHDEVKRLLCSLPELKGHELCRR